MQKEIVLRFSRWWLVAGLVALLVGGYRVVVRAQSGTGSPPRLIARGAGTTIIEGGTGKAGGFIPVTTKVAFHAEVLDGKVSGGFECLALVPPAKEGAQSGDFSNNVMYVTGQIQSAEVQGDVVTLRGISECTGLGAGSDVPFTAIIRKGGPGATVNLTVSSRPAPLTFKEILMDGSFDVRALPALDQ